MQEVFPMVSLWRAGFSKKRPVVALIGFKQDSRLLPNTPLLEASKLVLRQHLNGQNDIVPLISHYAGTLREDDNQLSNAPLNTDSRPVIEYLAPMNHRLEKSGKVDWFVGLELLDFVKPYLTRDALSSDPHLSEISSDWNDAIQAGYYLQASFLIKTGTQESKSQSQTNYESLIKKAASISIN